MTTALMELLTLLSFEEVAIAIAAVDDAGCCGGCDGYLRTVVILLLVTARMMKLQVAVVVFETKATAETVAAAGMMMAVDVSA